MIISVEGGTEIQENYRRDFKRDVSVVDGADQIVMDR